MVSDLRGKGVVTVDRYLKAQLSVFALLLAMLAAALCFRCTPQAQPQPRTPPGYKENPY